MENLRLDYLMTQCASWRHSVLVLSRLSTSRDSIKTSCGVFFIYVVRVLTSCQKS